MKKEQMEPLAIADLDIDELERRLELAAPGGQLRSWCTADSICGADCASLCGANVKLP